MTVWSRKETCFFLFKFSEATKGPAAQVTQPAEAWWLLSQLNEGSGHVHFWRQPGQPFRSQSFAISLSQLAKLGILVAGPREVIINAYISMSSPKVVHIKSMSGISKIHTPHTKVYNSDLDRCYLHER